MTGRHPCSPREVTLSALPAAAYRAGRDIFSIIPRERRVARVLALGSGEGELLMLLSRFFCIARASRPRRGTPRECSPLKTTRRLRSVLRSAFTTSVLREGGAGDPTGKEKRDEKKRRQPTRAKPPDVTLGSSRKMVNILIVDPHGSSVVGIKLYIIKSGRIGRIGSGGRGLSDKLGYASGDERHRITVDFASCYSRHGKRKPSESRSAVIRRCESVHTHA